MRPAARACPERACCLDRFRDSRVLGNRRVQQLVQPDDRERAHFGIELLSRTREQRVEQASSRRYQRMLS